MSLSKDSQRVLSAVILSDPGLEEWMASCPLWVQVEQTGLVESTIKKEISLGCLAG